MTDQPVHNPHLVRSFSTLIARLGEGALEEELSVQLDRLVEAMGDVLTRQGGKPKGEINLKISFKLAKGQMEIDTDYKVKAPRLDVGSSTTWVTPDGKLSFANPKQLELGLRAVPIDTAPVRPAS